MSLPMLSALAANMSAHIQASARDLQLAQQAIFNQQHFELKGDLIVFRETHQVFNQVRAVLKKVKDAGRTAITTLHGYAANVRTMDDRAAFSYVMVNFLGLRQNDPSVIEFLNLLAGAQDSPSTRHLSRAVEGTLNNLAAEIEQKMLLIKEIEGKLPNRFEAWVGLDNNAFNWRTQKFQTETKWNLGGKVANWASINSKVKNAKSSALSGVFAAGLTRAGLPSPAVQPTADMLAAVVLGGANA
jgi:hypothetical protein